MPLKSEAKGIFSEPQHPIVYQGLGLTLDSSNSMVFPILRAEPTTFSYSSEKDEVSTVSGEQLTLVAGYQTRINSRVTVTGSMSVCSNTNMLMRYTVKYHITLFSMG